MLTYLTLFSRVPFGTIYIDPESFMPHETAEVTFITPVSKLRAEAQTLVWWMPPDLLWFGCSLEIGCSVYVCLCDYTYVCTLAPDVAASNVNVMATVECACCWSQPALVIPQSSYHDSDWTWTLELDRAAVNYYFHCQWICWFFFFFWTLLTIKC